ncbi:hypothetical protein QAD02_010290 [Eretmocerus hayati]|uniref:Uncharacterized protein n=1 Tax=Eretmocerus hayati TaxID=131215 RepID=A0ACC2NBT3_9HYME|nr:hypothetical protein QAD02_010290 [Eretmocerus hayati]
MKSSGGSTSQSSSKFSPSGRIHKEPNAVLTGIKSNQCVEMYRRKVDITDPILREPFNYGWKRELAYRANPKKIPADIYYHPPKEKMVLYKRLKKSRSKLARNKTNGRNVNKNKIINWYSTLRSNIEVADFLELCYPGGELTVHNFSFSRKLLGLNDPEKEFIRFPKKRVRKIASDIAEKGDKSSTRTRSEPDLRNSKKTSGLSKIKRVSRKKNVNSTSSKLDETKKNAPRLLSISTKRPLCKRKLPSRIRTPVASTSVEQNLPKSKQNSRVYKKKYGRRRKLPLSSKQPASMNGTASSTPHIIFCETLISSTSDSPTDNLPTSTNADLNEYNPLEGLDSISVSSQTPSSIIPFKYPFLEYRDADTSVEELITASDHNQDSLVMNPLSEDLDEIHTKPRIFEPKIELVDKEPYLDVSELALDKPFHFKITISIENATDEIPEKRRFSTTFDDTPIFPQFCEALRDICPSLRDKTFTLHWQDPDGDNILVASCVELKEALSMMRNYRLIRFDVNVHNSNGLSERKTHWPE